MVAVGVLAANILGNQIRAVAVLRQQEPKRDAGPLVPFAVIDDAGRQRLEKFRGSRHAVLRELHHVVAEVEDG